MRFVCPKNGEIVPCLVDRDHGPHVHQREELVPKGRKAPTCQTHDIQLVRASR